MNENDTSRIQEIIAILAEMREDLEEESWIDEFPIVDEYGEPDDCGVRVVRRKDVYDWMDKIERVAKGEQEK